jgi:predicted ATPase
MRLYAWSGQHAAALRQYEACARLLEAELGAAPEPETTALYAAIKARRLEAPPARTTRAAADDAGDAGRAGVEQPASATPQHNLPPDSGFVGRQRELVDLIRRLTDPDCRLLTLVGPGGIGKTRLALRAGRVLADEWSGPNGLADGVLFVPLAEVDTPGGLVAALAAAAGLELHHDRPPQQQVLDHFRARRMLLILDNAEHLPGAAAFITGLLAAAPGVRLLVTSRAALNLHDEWFHPLDGLTFPTEDDRDATVAQLARYDAVRLFERHARRVRGDFSLGRARAAVVRLCQLVEGMPLAIELAAGWLKLFTAEQIVAALEQNLDILTAREQDIPARHRSMRAVLEESWALLPEAEQRALAGLAVFAGSFSAEAAAAVAGAGPDVLASLVEKALLRSTAEGRFQLHELLRQFAAAKLAADQASAQAAYQRHSHYYLDVLAAHEEWLCGRLPPAGSQPESRATALAAIEHEAANIRAAWRRAVEQRNLAALDRALYSYFIYFYMRGSVQEGEEIFGHATTLPVDPAEPLSARVRARALIRQGAFRLLLSDFEAAVRMVEAGLAAARPLGIVGDLACGAITLGAIAGWRGDATSARQHLSDALARGRALGDAYLVADALNELARLNGSYGDYREGIRLAQESLTLSRAAGLHDWVARALLTLGWSSACCGAYAAAEAAYRESLALARQIGDMLGVAEALGGIGWVAWCSGGERLDEARGCIEQSLATARQLGDAQRISNYLGDLALIAIDQGDLALAWDYGQEGLALARALDSGIYAVYHRGVLGHVAAARAQFAASRDYLREALHTAFGAHRWPMLAFAIYHAAALLLREATAIGDDTRAAARRAEALAWLTAIAQHPATWQVYQARARQLIDAAQGTLPPDQARAALERGRQLDWQADIAPLQAGLSA